MWRCFFVSTHTQYTGLTQRKKTLLLLLSLNSQPAADVIKSKEAQHQELRDLAQDTLFTASQNITQQEQLAPKAKSCKQKAHNTVLYLLYEHLRVYKFIARKIEKEFPDKKKKACHRLCMYCNHRIEPNQIKSKQNENKKATPTKTRQQQQQQAAHARVSGRSGRGKTAVEGGGRHLDSTTSKNRLCTKAARHAAHASPEKAPYVTTLADGLPHHPSNHTRFV